MIKDKTVGMTGPVKVMDIELSSPINDVEGLGKYMSLQVLVRLHGRPLGYAELPVKGGCCRGVDIIRVIQETLQESLAHEGLVLSWHSTPEGWMMGKTPFAPSRAEKDSLPLVTVAVCTRGRAQYLNMCLEAIEGLTYPRLDIILIDNAPKTNAIEIKVKREFPGVGYFVETRPGLDWARNLAVKEARGEIIAFTDDDVVVDPGWIDALVRVFRNDPEVMAVTGLVVPYELETEAQILFEIYQGFGKGFEARRVSRSNHTSCRAWSHLAAGDLGTGANMAFRRSVFDRIGGFDPALDTGTATGGGGDLEIFFRVIHEGYTLVYEPAAIVRHIHRREYSELKTQIRSWGTAFIAYLVRSAVAYPHARLRISCFAVRWFFGRHLIRILKNPKGDGHVPADLMLAELCGSFAGLLAYQSARHDAKRIKADLGPTD